LLLAINFQIDNCHSCQDEIDNFEKENAGKEPVELEWTKDYSIIISAKKTKGRKQSQQVLNLNCNLKETIAPTKCSWPTRISRWRRM
jgi:hypothetical protein